MMLLAEALTQLLHIWDARKLKTLAEALLRDRIPVILTQILNRTLLAQTTRGAWGAEEAPETTAYGVLTLMAVHSLPWHSPLQTVALSAARSGQRFLDQSRADWTKPAYVWIEKVTYGSARLSEAYCLAAMKASETSHSWSSEIKGLMDMPKKPMSKIVQLLETLETFRNEPRWKLIASAVEGYVFLPHLTAVGSTMLPEQKDAKNEYLAYIPFTWIVVNNHNQLFVSANMLWDMMVLTICNFRIDEYMESAVAKIPNDNLEAIRSLIHDLCNDKQPDECRAEVQDAKNPEKADFSTCHLPTKVEASVNETRINGMDSTTESLTTDANDRNSVSALTRVHTVLTHYTRAMLTYPRICGASTSDSSRFRNALHTFLLSHIAQIADNSNFASQPFWNSSTTSIFSSARQSFYSWVHNTGAESVSCPLSFAFLTCLLGATSSSAHKLPQEPADDCFGSARQQYLAQELCTHLAVMSRLYNDYGSVERDRIEANINSINFPEFHRTSSGIATVKDESRLKEEVLELAKIERQSADVTSEAFFRDLEGAIAAGGRSREKGKANAVRLFIGVTRLYADIYVARDLSNHIVASSG